MKSKLQLLGIFALFWLVLSCKNNQTASDSKSADQPVDLSENIFLEVETTPCYGECPVYTLTIYQDSTIQYNGKMFTQKTGKFAGKAKAKHIEQIKNALEQASFFKLNRVYNDSSVTDLPTTIIAAQTDGKKNHVKARYNEPDSFRKLSSFLFEFIDELPLKQVETK